MSKKIIAMEQAATHARSGTDQTVKEMEARLATQTTKLAVTEAELKQASHVKQNAEQKVEEGRQAVERQGAELIQVKLQVEDLKLKISATQDDLQQTRNRERDESQKATDAERKLLQLECQIKEGLIIDQRLTEEKKELEKKLKKFTDEEEKFAKVG